MKIINKNGKEIELAEKEYVDNKYSIVKGYFIGIICFKYSSRDVLLSFEIPEYLSSKKYNARVLSVKTHTTEGSFIEVSSVLAVAMEETLKVRCTFNSDIGSYCAEAYIEFKV